MEVKKFTRDIVLVLLIFLLVSLLFGLFQDALNRERKEVSFTQLVRDIDAGKVKKIIVSDSELSILYIDGKKGHSRAEPDTSLSQSLANYGVSKERLAEVDIVNRPRGGGWAWLGPILFTILPLLLFIGFFWFIMKQAKTGAMQAFDFTKARPRLFGVGGKKKEKVTFKDVGGLKEAKEELEEIVDFLKNSRKYLELGARIPRGVLLIGAPGTGKTLLARAIASEANVPFFSISASEVIELFVGVGSARIRSLFSQARKVGRAIIFIDEIDSIGKMRGVGVTGGHEEREQTLNQLLSEMDGIGREEGIIVLGATNKPESLDPALLRPGRFDRRIILDLPDINERKEILKIHCRGKPLASDVDLDEIVERTAGFSGADLANVANEAAILAAARNKHQIFQQEFLESIEKVLLGPERKSHLLSEKEKEITAYHEAGHALVSAFCPGAEPVRKISIIARGLAAGYTLKISSEEKKLKTKTEFLAEMATLLGGYCAEKLIFGEVTTGASNDLARATQLARKMVTEYGMSSLGPLVFGEREKLVFLGSEEVYRNYSEKVASKIDREVEKFVEGAQNRANKILLKKKDILEKLAKTLIEKETIEKEEFEQLVKKKTTKRKPSRSSKKEKSLSVKLKKI
ncbi:ATP-dependent zinc metalloprotease FtsH [bacterium]|nr:ATP-dependent zinc metalloprotease FtsH [bacterium]